MSWYVVWKRIHSTCIVLLQPRNHINTNFIPILRPLWGRESIIKVLFYYLNLESGVWSFLLLFSLYNLKAEHGVRLIQISLRSISFHCACEEVIGSSWIQTDRKLKSTFTSKSDLHYCLLKLTDCWVYNLSVKIVWNLTNRQHNGLLLPNFPLHSGLAIIHQYSTKNGQ